LIKSIGAAIMHPENRNLAEFQHYWAENHGPLYSNRRRVFGYIQHITLPEAYNGTPKPTFDGISTFFHEDMEGLTQQNGSPWDAGVGSFVTPDDRQLFDRIDNWPRQHKRASIAAVENAIRDERKRPEQVKLLMVVLRHPGLTHDEFFGYWKDVHGPIAAKLPGLRRYVQNHGLVAAQAERPMTHDGWSEMWFDDLASLQAAWASPEGEAMRENYKVLFAEPIGICIARERIQKWPGHMPKDWGVKGMSEEQIKERLLRDGYNDVASDPKLVARIQEAAYTGELLLWTNLHLAVMGEPRIDARPQTPSVK
jgi:uncharacterized protein (TIGR02118 family)